MADFKILVPFIKSWEGGYVNHPSDPGGHTNKGVTLDTFRQFFGKARTVADLKAMTDEQWLHIFKKGYWDRWKADEIESQSVANLLVDWVWASGVHGINKPQQLLGVTADGIVGPKTLSALNSLRRDEAFQRIWNRRKAFIEGLKNYNVFGNGWMNRLNSIKYCHLIYNNYRKLDGKALWETSLFNDTPPHNVRTEWLPKY